MILGNLLQQCYNVADTLIVGRFLGADALAAVGSAFTLMTFLTSILLGLSHGQRRGVLHLLRAAGRWDGCARASAPPLCCMAAVTALLNALVFGFDRADSRLHARDRERCAP